MTNPNDELLEKLRELHTEFSELQGDLSQQGELDGQTLSAMQTLVDDVAAMVDQANQAREKSTGEREAGGLRERVMEIEATHPRVANFLTQLTDLLARIGI